MLEELKEKVYASNLELKNRGVVIYTWGNVSAIDRDAELVVIKPSGVDYERMKPGDMVVVDLNGKVIEGALKPSTDTPTHLELYRKLPTIGGIAHTHSTYAVSFAQAGLSVPALGTTHADHFHGDVPCTRELTEAEVKDDYELNTGKVIVETVKYEPMQIPGIVVKNHGPFAWGSNSAEAVHNIVVLEHIAEMAVKTLFLNPESSLPQHIMEKHFMRKHGIDAYYGQS